MPICMTPAGGKLGTVSYGDKRIFTLPSAGTYSIQVYDSGHNGTGDYFVCLGGINPSSPDAVAIQRGDTKSGTIGSKGEMDPFVFTAAANDVVTLTVANTYSSPFQPYADLYTSTGSLVDTVSYGDKKVYTLPAAGTYTIQVYDSGHDATGNYTHRPARHQAFEPGRCPDPTRGHQEWDDRGGRGGRSLCLHRGRQ
jgi:hypothetical protein